MNKKGLATGAFVFYGMMISVMIWIAFTQMLDPVKDATVDARTVQKLDCSNSSISQGTKGTCIIVDWMMFGWSGAIIAMIIGAAGGGLIGTVKNKENP